MFTTQDLMADGLGMTSRSALDVALKRLVDEGLMVRAGRGLFYVPQQHPVLGKLPPDPQQLAEALARHTGAQLLPVGPDAANRLGLSQQVVGRPVFYTTGRSCRRKVGNRTIELRHRGPRLARADAVMAMVIEALRTLGRAEAASEQVQRQLRHVLTAKQKKQILAQLYMAPGWMHPILRSVTSSTRPLV